MVFGKIMNIELIENVTIESISLASAPYVVGLERTIAKQGGAEGLSGFAIVTDEHTFHLLVTDTDKLGGRCGCASDWNEDEFGIFEEAEIKDIQITCLAFDCTSLGTEKEYEGGALSLDVTTTKGNFSIKVFNKHDGNYVRELMFAIDEELLVQEEF